MSDTTLEDIIGTGQDNLGNFLLTLSGVSIGVVALGWFAGLREVAHNTLLSVMVFAFLPFIVIAAILTVLITLMIISQMITGSGLGLLKHGADAWRQSKKFTYKYYQFLSRRKNPVFWGVPAGVLFGGLLLMFLTWPLIIKKEQVTVARLETLQTAMTEYQAQHGAFPAPDDQGRLLLETLGLPENDGPYATDGFGRPFKYTVTGAVEKAQTEAQTDENAVEANVGTQDGVTDKMKSGLAAVAAKMKRDDGVDQEPNALAEQMKAGMAAVAERMKRTDTEDQDKSGQTVAFTEKMKAGMAAAAKKATAVKNNLAVGTYTIESSGYNPENPSDDLVLNGATPLSEKWAALKTAASDTKNWMKAGYEAGKILSMYRQ